MKLKSIIVDDEELARKNLSMLLEEYCPEIEIIGDAGNVTDAKELIESEKPDVVFLDIRMPSGSEGFDLLESIENRNFLVVFVTAFKDYALRAFQANAIHYVLKPIDIEDLKDAVSRLVESKTAFAENPENFDTYFESIKNLSTSMESEGYGNKVAISHTKGIKLVHIEDIMYLEASGNCTVLYFADGTRYLDTRTLKIYEGILNPEIFYRIHKSHIINLDYLKEYLNEDGHFAVLKNGKLLPVARNRVSTFVKTLKSL
ncbi:LytTR family DNA-binding domain-containing protein [Paracrocinitomix mangrovi]|uniref:LytR/AlgR family response regulator transcription factor n=1 Tax=Paracrocinitomix mangrovi TaxID=2862509 RepID=UPI001C8D025D|nr:LytTR family DNA-binding domain-containing protein [Paracrocinitomix mangrovi]UKN00166.1 LytTR family DNA-binding domain-containing protein [Paracrocinitomix mangrovi]